MRKFLLFLLSLPLVLVAQQRVLGPYLQNAEPTSIVVMWETSFATNSRLSYGLSPSLGSVANGNSAAGFLLSKIHTVKINDLQPNTHYYYSVNFGGSYSDSIRHLCLIQNNLLEWLLSQICKKMPVNPINSMKLLKKV
jgi:hypothetical protein